MRLLTTGSRHWDDEGTIEQWILRVISWFTQPHPDFELEVYHGDGPGADQIVEAWCNRMRLPVCKCPPERYGLSFAKDGFRAGPMRNAKMVTEARPDFALAFWLKGARNVGTGDCIRRLRVAGVPRLIIPSRPKLGGVVIEGPEIKTLSGLKRSKMMPWGREP